MGLFPRLERGGAALLAFLLVAHALVAEPREAGAKGHLVLVGGGKKPRSVLSKFVELSGGARARILIVPTASKDSEAGEENKKVLEKEFGCQNVKVLPISTRADAQRQLLADMVEEAGGVFFTGGDQRRIVSALRDTIVLDALRRVFAKGAVVGGTSAGAACMSELMLTGEGKPDILKAKNVELWPGLGFWKGVIVDQHFVARQRQNRLISAVLENPDSLGVGVDEGTAVWVKPDGTFEVLGEGSVFVFDASGASITSRPSAGGSSLLGVQALLTHVLLPGEVFDAAARKVVPGTERPSAP
ncbi:MAG: cyanophycinase [Acidobacteria bacterium]|nr:cyanophycinase [Acidobacteriota bacterium]MCG3195277.1 Cyanophycinase [Thermoanaerobaculia bacterium]MCK6683751.1 cyanophycinase [Thermoanaerobaculia bacterium]